MPRILPVLLVALAGIAAADEFPAPVNTQAAGEHPPSPREMLDVFELPDGFQVKLFAGEPDVQQPISFDFDDKGRIWVAENYTYAGRGIIDPDQRDRVIILHDKDGDGEHDERKVFWDKGSMLTSLTWGYGGLWILNDGTLSFIPDKNGDDVPDGEPVVLLNGWTKKARHNFVNGLLWGPDGWLYGRHGITETSYPGTPDTPRAERQPMNCGIWRFHPTKHTFEVVCHGTTNPWGLDYNEVGDMFMTNNVIGHLWHVIPGAHYERMFGQDFNPHCYELMGPTSDHYHWDTTGKWNESRDGAADDLGGGHSHCGGMIYYGQNFPEEYHGKIFMCNTHGRCVNVNRLERKGSTYVGKREPNFLKVNTPWFRGVELKYGPRGCVYLTDWSDNGECHDHDGVHRTSGRIYRISYGEVCPPKNFAISEILKRQRPETIHPVKLWDRLLSTHFDAWERRKCRRLLYEQIHSHLQQHPNFSTADDSFWKTLNEQDYTSTKIGDGSAATLPRRDIAPFKLATMDREGFVGYEQANFLCSIDAVTPGIARRLLLSNSEYVRSRIATHIFESPKLRKSVRTTFHGALRLNTSPVVAMAYASGLQKLPRTPFSAVRDPEFQRRLASQQLDSLVVGYLLTSGTPTSEMLPEDQYLKLMTWYAMEHHSLFGLHPECPSEHILKWATQLAVSLTDVSNPDDRGIGLSLHMLVAFPESAKIPHVRSQLQAVLNGLRGRRNVAMPKTWDATHEKLREYDDEEIDELALRLSAVFGGQVGVDDLHSLVADRNGSHEQRSRAITTIEELGRDESIPVLLPLLTDRAVYVDVARALAAFDDPRIPAELLKRWNALRHGSQEAAMDTLISRKSYALLLVKAIDAGRVDSAALSAAQVRQLMSFNDPTITKIIEANWGVINESSEGKEAMIAELKQKLTPDVLAAADLTNGAALFKKSCAACHKLYGEGGTIGPDLTGANRGNMDYLLGNIVDPSAEVPKQFTVSVIALTSGRIITGVVIGETEQVITVQTDKEQMTIAVADIEERTRTTKSLMPDGLLDALTEDQRRDLIAFIQHRAGSPRRAIGVAGE